MSESPAATSPLPFTTDSTEPTPAVHAAVEQVVKTSGDLGVLTTATRELAGLLGYDLVPKPGALLVHAKFGGHYEQHGGRDEYVTPCGTVGASKLTGLWGCITCDGCIEALRDDEAGYETDADPTPRDGDHGTCVFGCAIRHFERDGLSWWAHETEPADGHDAEIGGPA